MVDHIIDRIDDFQRRHRGASFLWAVQKKYGDDRGGYLSALVTYYGFLSIFPLLLAAFTIVAYTLSGDHSAANTIQRHIQDYPIVNQVAPSLGNGTLSGSPIALIVGLLGLIWGSQGLAQAAQFTLDEALNIANKDRLGFLPRTLRSFGWYTMFGVGALISTFIASLGPALGWAGGDVLSTLLSMVLDVGLFTLSFWILTPKDVSIREVLPGAAGAGVAWAVLTGVGVGLTKQLAHSNPLYGSFASVLGLLGLIYLNARITIYCIEANEVYKRHLWPRALTNRNLTRADLQQLDNLAGKEERVPAEEIEVDVDGEPARQA
ncbi:MAG TPA: YhjD/YihY/BrkB family envelope integrity protein [Acidimicrobiales bacterium]|jgi:uncharacterized BrkB/YihY/UPF0761 family membrane protein|nr:YhjD/YihY/BrkB family envelope integrity protein [Acidimicrobiales bacterium]